MAMNQELDGQEVAKKSIEGPRKLTLTELSSMLHGVLFAYEKVFLDLYGNDARELYPYILEELAHVLHTGDDPIIDKTKNLDENLDRVLFFLSNEEYLKELKCERLTDGKYVFDIGACSFAKSGVHDILKIKEGICPFALIFASCLTDLTSNGYARITKAEFDDEGSKTYIETVKAGEESAVKRTTYQDMDERIFNAQAFKPSLDELDMSLIKELRKDARLSNVELAKMLESSESTIRRRIGSMMDRGIIKGFSALVHCPEGSTFQRAFITIKTSPDNMDNVAARLAKRKEICSVYKTIGNHNLICEFIFKENSEFQEFIDGLQFSEGISEVSYYLASSAPKPCPWYGF
jgi:Lrp/AsnC family transcriptional regulator for asnA, asnC and gidA